jgi:hypothetical protein
MIYTEEGEEQLIKLLSPLFKTDELIRGFLNYCTSYMIVQNYSQNIQAWYDTIKHLLFVVTH